MSCTDVHLVVGHGPSCHQSIGRSLLAIISVRSPNIIVAFGSLQRSRHPLLPCPTNGWPENGEAGTRTSLCRRNDRITSTMPLTHCGGDRVQDHAHTGTFTQELQCPIAHSGRNRGWEKKDVSFFIIPQLFE